MTEITGRMTERVQFEEPVDVADGGGGATRSWRVYATAWAAISTRRVNEAQYADRVTNPDEAEILVHVNRAIHAGHRVSAAAGIYEILAISDHPERSDIVVIRARRGRLQ